MADAEDLPLQPAEAGAERHVEPFEDDLPEHVGVAPLGHDDRGQHAAVLRGVGGDDVEAPRLHRGARGAAEALVACDDGVEPLFPQHGERLAQAIEDVGRRRVGEEAGRVVAQHRLPVPVGARQLRALRGGERLVADGVEADARRQHQPFLRAADGDVDAPCLVPVFDRAERGDGVDEQQRRVARRVDLLPDLGDAAHHARGRLVVDDADGLDLVLAVVGEPGEDHGRVGAPAPVALDPVDLQAHPRRDVFPQRGEVAGLEHQHPVARRQRVDERGLPRAGARPRVDDDG